MRGNLFRWASLTLLMAALPAFGQGVGWRGDGTGRYTGAEPPTDWDIDAGTNILWQAEVGKGQSSPVVVGRRIFITAEPDVLLCLARDSGEVLWRRNDGYDTLPPALRPPGDQRARAHKDCGYSTATPVADRSAVFAGFGSGVVVCYAHDGRRRWIRYFDRKVVPEYGRTASPLLVGGKLLVSLGGLLALDPKTGETVWETPEAKPSYGTPAVARIADADVVITPNGDCVRVADGRILAIKLGQLEYPSPLVHRGVVYFVGQPAVALKLPERPADRIQPEKLWETDELEGEFYASPVYHGGLLYCVCNEGILYALDAQSGKIVFQKELGIGSAGGMPGIQPANIYGSLTLAGKVMLLTNDIGETLVLAPERQYREHSHNYLDQGSGASPVADEKLLLLRGGGKLYGLGRR